jgi:hypothetical protein
LLYVQHKQQDTLKTPEELRLSQATHRELSCSFRSLQYERSAEFGRHLTDLWPPSSAGGVAAFDRLAWDYRTYTPQRSDRASRYGKTFTPLSKISLRSPRNTAHFLSGLYRPTVSAREKRPRVSAVDIVRPALISKPMMSWSRSITSPLQPRLQCGMLIEPNPSAVRGYSR